MAIIKRNRTLRPSSREPQSTYKIDTSKVGIDDTLYVTITHEDNAEFKEVYIFEGKDLVDKNSIHYSYDEECIKWLGNLTYRKLDVSEINTREKKSAKREEKSKNEIKWIDDFTLGYPNRTWRNAGIAMLVIIILGFIIAVDNKGNTPNKFYQGQECIFTKDAVGGINESTSKQLTQYAIDKDQYGVLELNMRGEAYFALAGDECTYIRNKGGGLIQVYLKKKRVEIIVPETCIRPK